MGDILNDLFNFILRCKISHQGMQNINLHANILSWSEIVPLPTRKFTRLQVCRINNCHRQILHPEKIIWLWKRASMKICINLSLLKWFFMLLLQLIRLLSLLTFDYTSGELFNLRSKISLHDEIAFIIHRNNSSLLINSFVDH